MMSASDIRCLKNNVFFGSLPDEVLDHVVTQSRAADVKAGDTIFHQGEDANMIYCIVDGVVKLTVSAINGDTVVVDLFHAGDSFAEALAFRDAPYPVSAAALSDARVVAVPKNKIQSELRANPDAYPAVMTAAYTHLHRLVRQIEQLKAASGSQRAAGFILALAESQENATEFEIPYEKQTIASMLGIQPETLSRAFKRLAEHGLSVRGQKVRILDRVALENYLNDG